MVYKLKCNGISGNLFKLLEGYLKCMPDWKQINDGVPRGSLLGLLFLVYINDLTDNISYKMLTIPPYLLVQMELKRREKIIDENDL